LRDKLKEFLDTENGSSKLRDLKETAQRLEQLERECEVLRAQNLALRKSATAGELRAAGTGGGSMFGPAGGGDGPQAAGGGGPGAAGRYGAPAAAGGRTLGGSTGHVLGGGDGPAGGGGDDVRAHLHGKWEADKKLQARLGTLEKRLKEKIEESDDLAAQLKKAREVAQGALAAKDEMAKKLQAAGAKHPADVPGAAGAGKKGSAEDVIGLEQAQARVFSLEDEVVSLRRRCEVDLPNEVANLRHQLSVSRAREVRPSPTALSLSLTPHVSRIDLVPLHPAAPHHMCVVVVVVARAGRVGQRVGRTAAAGPPRRLRRPQGLVARVRGALRAGRTPARGLGAVAQATAGPGGGIAGPRLPRDGDQVRPGSQGEGARGESGCGVVD